MPARAVHTAVWQCMHKGTAPTQVPAGWIMWPPVLYWVCQAGWRQGRAQFQRAGLGRGGIGPDPGAVAEGPILALRA